MPAWNPWIWSGTPLLGGFNAGALYPGTLLFAALNPLAAWVLNEIAVFAVCGVGLYLLFRNHRLVPLAAAIGAVSFTFAGFMQAHARALRTDPGDELGAVAAACDRSSGRRVDAPARMVGGPGRVRGPRDPVGRATQRWPTSPWSCSCTARSWSGAALTGTSCSPRSVRPRCSRSRSVPSNSFPGWTSLPYRSAGTSVSAGTPSDRCDSVN